MRRISLLLSLAGCLGLAACGSEDAQSPPSAAVTIENKLGTAEVPREPQRVVALDVASADDALALGVVPVAIAKLDYAEGGLQPWTAAALRGKPRPELLDATSAIPFERIAALRPDVILATNTYNLEKTYGKLAGIAPVVTYADGEGIDTSQQSALRIGRALGREARARELVEQIEADVAAARRDHPAFDGRTISFFNFWDGSPWVVTEPDFSIRFLSELGLRVPPAVAELKGEQGRGQVSTERLDVLDADVIMATSPAPEELQRFARSPVFQRLDPIRRGAYVELDLSTAASIAFPSLLSVPYGLRGIVPELATALG